MRSQIRNSRLLIFLALIAAVLTLLLYGGALTLPFYSDDLLQVPWVERTPMVDFWHQVGPYRDYRPLHFTLWRLLYLLIGDLNPVGLHLLNLVTHAAVGLLVGLLAHRLGGGWQVALLTAVFFVAFPFAFDAVPWAIAFSYPLTAALALGGLLIYLRARRSGSLACHLLAALLTALAGFAHEGGAVAGGAILLAELALRPGPRQRLSPWPLAHLLVSGAAFLAAALVRPQGTVLGGLTWPDAVYNLGYALQTLAFPVAPLANGLAQLGLNPALAMALVGIPALMAVGWGVRRALGSGPLFLALGWWLLWCLPPLLTLRFDWLRDAPRAFYAAVPGVALAWAGAVVHASQWRGRASAALTVALTVACLAPAGWFVLSRVDLHCRTGRLLWDVVAAAREGDSLLVVNLPSRITPSGRLYPLGHEGIIPLPPRVGAGDLVRAHGGRAEAAVERAWGPVLPSLPYDVQPLGATLAPADLRAADRVAMVVYRADGMGLEEVGAVRRPQDVDAPVARFGEDLLLLRASCQRSESGQVVLSTHWQALSSIQGTPTIFAHVLGADGERMAQMDGEPLQGLYPLSLWQPGDVVWDLRSSEASSSGPVSVALGIWDPVRGTRWEVTALEGEAGAGADSWSVPCRP